MRVRESEIHEPIAELIDPTVRRHALLHHAKPVIAAPVDVQFGIADDFVSVDPQGHVYDKSALLANTRDGPKHFVSNQLGPVTIRCFGETAIAQGEETWVRHRGEPRSGRFVWIDTWVRRSGHWQIAAAQDAFAEVR